MIIPGNGIIGNGDPFASSAAIPNPSIESSLLRSNGTDWVEITDCRIDGDGNLQFVSLVDQTITKTGGDLQIIADNVRLSGNVFIDGTVFSNDAENLVITDSYIDLNAAYVSTTPRTAGQVYNIGATGLSDTVTAGSFVAGIASTSNPTVETDSSATYAQNDIIQLSGFINNNGVYEVEDHTGIILTVRGIGTVGTVDDFARNQFITGTDTGVIEKINVVISRANTSGLMEEGTGSTIPITYTELTSGLWTKTGAYLFTTTSGDGIQLDGHILPITDGVPNLGDTDHRFGEVWITGTSLHIGDSTVDTTVSFTNITGTAIYLGGQSGLDDLTISGTYSGLDAATFEITIDSVSGPDTFAWRKGTGSWTAGVTITGTAQLLSDGISATFGATTGHKNNDTWLAGAGWRTRIDKESAISGVTSIDSTLFVAGSVEALGTMNVNGDMTHSNGDYIINPNENTDIQSFIYRDEDSVEQLRAQWDAANDVLSYIGNSGIYFENTPGISLVDTDIHFRPSVHAGNLSLIFYEDTPAGGTEQMRIKWQESSRGALQFIGDANLEFYNTFGISTYWENSGNDGDGIFYLAMTGTNSSDAEIFLGDRDPNGNVSPSAYSGLYLRGDSTGDNNGAYIYNGLDSTWHELFALETDSSAIFTDDVTIEGQAVIGSTITGNFNPTDSVLDIFAPAKYVYIDSNVGGEWGIKFRGRPASDFIDVAKFTINGSTGQMDIGGVVSSYFPVFLSGSNEVAKFHVSGGFSFGAGSIATDPGVGNMLIEGDISGAAGTLSGDLAVNTDNLFVDVSTETVGLGTVTPRSSSKLDIVNENSDAGLWSHGAELTFQNPSTTDNTYSAIGFRGESGSISAGILAKYTDTSEGYGRMYLSTRSSTAWRPFNLVLEDNMIGVGKIPTLSALDVNGIGTFSGGVQLNGDSYVANNYGLVIGHDAQITTPVASEFQMLGTGSADSQMIFGRFANDTFAPALNFVKSRNTDIGATYSIVQDGDDLGIMAFFADDGTDYATRVANIFVEVNDPAPEAGSIGVDIVWEQMSGTGTTRPETMRLSAVGDLNLLLGDFNIATGNLLMGNSQQIQLGDAGQGEISADGAGVYINNTLSTYIDSSAGDICFNAANAVGINTTTPDNVGLHVYNHILQVGADNDQAANRLQISATGGLKHTFGLNDGTASSNHGRFEIMNNVSAVVEAGNNSGGFIPRVGTGQWGAMIGGGSGDLRFFTGGTSPSYQGYDNLSATLALTIEASGDILVPEDAKLIFGANLEFLHDGNAAWITNSVGEFNFENLGITSDVNVFLGSDTDATRFTVQNTSLEDLFAAGGDSVTVYGNEVATKGLEVVEVWSLDDLPTPVSGVITIEQKLYRWMDNIDFGTNQIQLENGQYTVFECDDSFITAVTYSGTDPWIIGEGTIRCPGLGMTWMLTAADGATMFDLEGAFGMYFSSILATGTNASLGEIRAPTTEGVLVGTRFFIKGTSVVSGFKYGLTLVNPGTVEIDNSFFYDIAASEGSLINIEGTAVSVKILGNEVKLLSTSSAFLNIAPTVESLVVSVSNTVLTGENVLFESGSTGTFTAVADATITAESITSVTDSGGTFAQARFNYDGAPATYVGQEVTISGYTTYPQYNGTYIIDVVGVGWFEIYSILFDMPELGGSFDSDSVTLTDTGTTLVDGDAILIDTDESTDYDGGSYVYNQQTNTVQVNKVWAATETGTWDTGSLTEDSKYINSINNGEQRDSRNSMFAYVNANTDTTSFLAIDTWYPLQLDGIVEGIETRGFKYIGDNLFEVTTLNSILGTFEANLTAIKTVGSKDYDFRAVVVTGTGSFDGVIKEHSIGTDSSSFTVKSSAQLFPGDIFGVEVRTPTTMTNSTMTATGFTGEFS